MELTAADLRALVAYHQIKLYELGARIGYHPTRLGQVLNGNLPLPPDLAERIRAAIDESAAPLRENEVPALLLEAVQPPEPPPPQSKR